MTPHHHRWVKRRHWACTAMVNDYWCKRESVVGCWSGCDPTGAHSARCRFHDPRRPPTPAEREERRVLLRAARWFASDKPFPAPRAADEWIVSYDGMQFFSDLARILESAAYSWTNGKFGR